MKKIYILLSLLSVMSFISSCYVDKGNYEYTTISDILIDGFDDTYVLKSLVDTLVVNPIVSTDYPKEDLEYNWIIYDSKNERDTISNEPNLSYFITKAPGNYTLFYYVYNKNNGYYNFTRTKLEVGTLFSRGHYLLKETENGNTDLDLYIAEGEKLDNIITNTYGSSISGSPRSMGILYDKSMINPDNNEKTNAHSLGIITYNDVIEVYRASDLRKVFDKESLFYEKHSATPYKFLTGVWNNDYISSDGLFFTSTRNQESGKFGFPRGESGGSDKIAYSETFLAAVYWDEHSKRIIHTNYNSQATVLVSDQFPTSGMDYECMAMVNCRGAVYGLFKDNTKTSAYKLYRIYASSFSGVPKVQSVVELDSSYGLVSARLFAGNEKTAQMIYFVKDNSLFYFDVTSNREYAVEIPGIAPGEEITYISNRHYNLTSPAFDYFVVATYKDSVYKLYMYNMVGGLPVGEPIHYVTGSGKIKEVHYLSYTFDYFYMLMGSGYSR